MSGRIGTGGHGGRMLPWSPGWSPGRRYCFLQMSDLERELEQELHRVLDPITALPIPARRQPEARRAARALLGGAGAALTVKVLTGVAVAAAAVTVAGAATTG